MCHIQWKWSVIKDKNLFVEGMSFFPVITFRGLAGKEKERKVHHILM